MRVVYHFNCKPCLNTHLHNHLQANTLVMGWNDLPRGYATTAPTLNLTNVYISLGGFFFSFIPTSFVFTIVTACRHPSLCQFSPQHIVECDDLSTTHTTMSTAIKHPFECVVFIELPDPDNILMVLHMIRSFPKEQIAVVLSPRIPDLSVPRYGDELDSIKKRSDYRR